MSLGEEEDDYTETTSRCSNKRLCAYYVCPFGGKTTHGKVPSIGEFSRNPGRLSHRLVLFFFFFISHLTFTLV